jgi:Ni/Fe-hydrogenase subunit HybB-like protein
MFGLGSVTNLNGGYPWGVWVGVDVIIGTAFGCGGFAMALLVYIFNKGEYHPLMRPALLGGLFGYTLGGMAVIFDLGRYWNFYNLLLPWYAQPSSVMFEVALCVMAYILVLWIEFSPTFLERFGLTNAKQKLKRFMYVIIALGVLLPTMHQSSLGSLLLVMGSQLSPLWFTAWLPLWFLLTAITMGYGIVILESTLITNAFKLPSEQRILSKLSPIVGWLLATFLVLRFMDLLAHGHVAPMFAADVNAFMFWLEILVFVIPAVILISPARSTDQRQMFVAALLLLAAGSLYRINAYLVAYDPGNGWNYFPSAPEIMVTIGVIALEIMLYLVFVKKLPVLHGTRPA